MANRERGPFPVIPILTPCILILALFGCKPASTPPGGPTAEAPAMDVSTVTVQATTVPRVIDLPGRLASTRVAEVRAQVSGVIQQRVFEEGSLVKKGDVLFVIDQAVYKAEVDARTAAVARADATRVQAQRQSERTGTLVERQAASTAQNDIAIATLLQAEADVASAKAQLARAKIDLDFATVRAPIAGRIGRALVTEGALVNPGDATKLAVIQQIDPIFADFNASASEPGALAERAGGKTEAEVRLVQADGGAYPDAGRLLFTDVSVDPGTGQVSLRASFPNPKGALLPGTYARVRMTQGLKADAVVVPAQAIQRSSAGEAQAYVVLDGKLALRPLRTGALTDEGWVIEEGLKAGDVAVVEGFQKIQPGMPVNPVPWRNGRTAAGPDRN